MLQSNQQGATNADIVINTIILFISYLSAALGHFWSSAFSILLSTASEK
jgi:hypothetical protein